MTRGGCAPVCQRCASAERRGANVMSSYERVADLASEKPCQFIPFDITSNVNLLHKACTPAPRTGVAMRLLHAHCAISGMAFQGRDDGSARPVLQVAFHVSKHLSSFKHWPMGLHAARWCPEGSVEQTQQGWCILRLDSIIVNCCAMCPCTGQGYMMWGSQAHQDSLSSPSTLYKQPWLISGSICSFQGYGATLYI